MRAKNLTRKSDGRGKTQDGVISLVLFSNEKGASLGSIDLTGAEFDALKARAENLNIPLDKMLRAGFSQMFGDVNWHRCFQCVRGSN